MKCTNCQAELKSLTKFCGTCGTKVVTAGLGRSPIELSPDALGLAPCQVTLLDATATRPDTDGDVRVMARFKVSNSSAEDWDLVTVRAQLLDSAGLPITDAREEYDSCVQAGSSAEYEANFGYVALKELEPNSESAVIVLQAMACKKVVLPIGKQALVVDPHSAQAIDPVEIKDCVKLISGRLWTNKPDADGYVELTVTAMVQNLTATQLPQVRIGASMVNAAGDAVADPVEASQEIRPGEVVVLRNNGSADRKAYKRASVMLELNAFVPVASGAVLQKGLSVEEPLPAGSPAFDTLEGKLIELRQCYDDGWNDEGTPATFLFPDGVSLNYDETDFDDEVDEFIDALNSCETWMNPAFRDAISESRVVYNPYRFTYALDFSEHEDFQGRDGDLTVEVSWLQGSDDEMCEPVEVGGTVVIGSGVDRDWLYQWMKNVNENDSKVERA